MARCVAYPAATMQSTSVMSGLLDRLTARITGVRARATPATRPAVRPQARRTAAISKATAPTPQSTDGNSSDQELKPKIRAESAWSQNASGGLSTVIQPPGSSVP